MDVPMINSGKVFFRSLVLICGITTGLSGCGGGGGSSGSNGNSGSSSSTPVIVTPTPMVTLSASKAKIWVGESVDVTLETKDAASCTSIPAIGLTGTSGTYTVKDLKPGLNEIKVTCLNEDKTATKSVQVIVPLPVLPTSYENAKTSEYLPSKVDLSKIKVDKGSITSAFSFADFTQTGESGLVVSTLLDSVNTGEIRFFKYQSGQWIDNTSELLNTSDYSSCIHPRKSVVADFNNDKKPDVFFACHGTDFIPFPGETSILLLSNVNGKYDKKYIEATSGGFTHGASAADLNDDSNIDLVIVDPSRNDGTTPLYVLYGNGDGSFNVDYSRVPQDIVKGKAWYSVELMDADDDGDVELLAGGHEYTPNNERKEHWYAPTIIFTLENGYFNFGTELPFIDAYGVVLDFVRQNNVLYILRSNIDEAANEFYTKAAIQRIDLSSKASNLIYEHSGNYVSNIQWVDWIGISKDKIVSLDWRYELEVEVK